MADPSSNPASGRGAGGGSNDRSFFAQAWPRIVLVLVILAIWAIASAFGGFGDKLPSPADVWNAMTTNLFGADGLVAAAGRSLLRLVVGLAVGIAIGTPLGLWMAASKPVQRSIGSLMVALEALPPIVWLPLAILWFGFGMRAVLFIVIIAVTPAVAIATAASVRLVSPTMLRAGRTLGASGSELYRNVVLPAAVPGYVAGLRQAWTAAWWALLAGELITTGARGLGHFMEDGGGSFDVSLLLAVMIVVMIVGLAVDGLFASADRRVRRRRGLLATP